jgi:hypothetical protein
MDVAKIAAQQLIESNGGNPAQDQSFRMIFQEQMANPQQAGTSSPASLIRAIGQNFIETESRLQVEKLNLMTAYIGPLANSSAQVGVGSKPTSAGISSSGISQTNFSPSSVSSMPPVSSTSSASQGYSVSNASAGNVQPPSMQNNKTVYSESRNDTPTPMQAALGLTSDASTNSFDFAGNIQNMTSKINSATSDLKEALKVRPKGIEDTTRHNTAVQSRIREIDDMSNQRSMLASLHVSSFQENRTRMLTVYEHVTGTFKKLNEIVNSLKQSS